jgi:hypothetical protein
MTEKQLHKQITDYLHLQYPKCIFTTDSSGLRMSIGEAVRVKKLRSSNDFPDIMIFEPKPIGKNKDLFYCCGLFIEVKIESPFKKKSNDILKEHAGQYEMINKLKERGYWAVFVWTFDMAKDTIDKYLK